MGNGEMHDFTPYWGAARPKFFEMLLTPWDLCPALAVYSLIQLGGKTNILCVSKRLFTPRSNANFALGIKRRLTVYSPGKPCTLHSAHCAQW